MRSTLGAAAGRLAVVAMVAVGLWAAQGGAAHGQTCLSWTQQTGPGPAARVYHVAALDPVRNRVVLFGGIGNGLLSDTWEWDGAVWTQRSTGGVGAPPARSEAAMWYDPVRQRVVLFGGAGVGGLLNDMWEWNGSAWSQLSPAARPSARRAHAAAFDVARGRAVLFGGADAAGLLRDTWEWTGTTWALAATTGPVARSAHAVVYDATINRVVMTGGAAGDTGLYSWSGAAWTTEAASNPPGAWVHAAAAAAPTPPSRMFVFGGYDFASQSISGRLQELSPTGWTQRTANVPGVRRGASLTALGPNLIMFGGIDLVGNLQGETWVLTPGVNLPPFVVGQPTGRAVAEGVAVSLNATVQGATPLTFRWQRDGVDLVNGGGVSGAGSTTLALAPPAPVAGRYRLRASNTCGTVTTTEAVVTVGPCPTVWGARPVASAGSARDVAAVTFDSGRNRVVVFAGAGAQFTDYLKDVLEFDGRSWRLVNTIAPVARAFPGMAYMPALGKSVMYGGLDFQQTRLADTWTWDGSAWVQLNIPGPPGRGAHALVYDSVRGRIVVFGGQGDGTSVRGDTWEFDGSAWTQRMIPGPTARQAAAATFDSTRGVMVLHGGILAGGIFVNDTWEYNGTAWTQRVGVGGPIRARHSMAYDPVRQRAMMFGGRVSETVDQSETWEYDGTAWQLRVPGPGTPTPLARRHAALVFNPISGKVLMFGGRNGNQAAAGYQADTWEVGLGPTVLTNPAPTVAAVGSTATLTVTATAVSTGPLTVRWLKDGQALVDGPGISGSGGTVLMLTGVTAASAGEYSAELRSPADCLTLSLSAPLSVTPVACSIADIVGIGGSPPADGLLSGDDFNAFIGAFAAGNLLADITGIGGPPNATDGLLTGDDFNAFIAGFAAGCP